jgi:hypothetical protein
LLKRLAIRLAVTGIATVAVGAVSAPAYAHHSHVLETPGTCVDKAGAGFGTDEPHDRPSFHSQVHKGKPGLFAFERANNPVSVVGFKLCQ